MESAAAYQKLNEEALYALNEALKTAELKIHSVTSRIKSFESFAAKIERKRLTEPLNEIRDIVGLRVVCLFLSDIDKVSHLIEETFDIIERDNKIDGGEVTSFGYMSFHFIVKMKAAYAGPRYKDIRDRAFEIQVRTIAMDAWAAASHYLDYKNEDDVPSSLRRDFFALSGLFYVADRHFEMFYRSKTAGIAKITKTLERPVTELDNQELNLDTLNAYLARTFPDRTQSPSAASQLLHEIKSAGIANIKDLDNLVKKNMKAFEAHEIKRPPGAPGGKKDAPTKYAAVGVVRIILNEQFG